MQKEHITNESNKYLYLISSRREYRELCSLEMKYLFGKTTTDSYHLTNQSIHVSRSTFFKGKVSILFNEESLEILEEKLNNNPLDTEDYYIHFYKADTVDYKTRLTALRRIGYTILGDFAIKNPNVEFVLTKINNRWIFGMLENNPNDWINRKQKPVNYSHALEVKFAKSIVNLAIGNDFTKTVVDPCSGIGTVLIEALAMGVTIKGYEINPLVANNSRINISHFNFKPDVTKLDMHQITEHFDVSILDLPYGHYSNITREEQIGLIRKTNEISNKSVIVSMEDMTEIYLSLDLEIIDSCQIIKSNTFRRYVTICKQKQSKI